MSFGEKQDNEGIHNEQKISKTEQIMKHTEFPEQKNAIYMCC